MNTSFIFASIGVFLIVILLLVVILLVAKKFLSPSGNVNIEINGDKTINVPQGSSLMTTLNENGIFLPSACGGKASCGQCKVQVLEGGGEILDSEKPHFTRKQIKDNWRLGCQCKVKSDMKIKVPDSVMSARLSRTRTFLHSSRSLRWLCLRANTWTSFLVLTHRSRFRHTTASTTTRTSTRILLARSISAHGRSSTSSRSRLTTRSLQCVPTQWQTIRTRAISSHLQCVSPQLRSCHVRRWASRTYRPVSLRRTSSH